MAALELPLLSGAAAWAGVEGPAYYPDNPDDHEHQGPRGQRAIGGALAPALAELAAARGVGP